MPIITNKPAPRIAIAVSNGWVFRNLLETNLLKKLDILDNVIFIIDKEIAQDSVSFLENKRIEYKVIEFKKHKFTNLVKSLYLYVEVFRIAPFYSKKKFDTRLRKILLNLLILMKNVNFFNLFQETILRLLNFLLKRNSRKLDIPKFDLFLSAAPNSVQDNIVAAWSSERGIPIINLILSWDNIFTKGYMAPADLYGVWGQVMKKQMSKLFDIRPSKIMIVGAPHIGGIRPMAGAPVVRDTLLYSTSAAVHFPDEKELVEKLSIDFAAGIFPSFSRLVIRTHPLGPNELFDGFASRDNNVFIEHPTRLDGRKGNIWLPQENELERLGDQLSKVSVAVNMASTMSLDCLVNGITVINITRALNGRDLSRYYQSEHYASLLELGLVKLAGSYSDLVSTINTSRQTPDHLAAKRIEDFIFPTDINTLRQFRERIFSLYAERLDKSS